MAGKALKSCKAWVKCDNGYTATGRASTKTYTFKGANTKGTAEHFVGAMSSVIAVTQTTPLVYGKSDEYLVSDEL